MSHLPFNENAIAFYKGNNIDRHTFEKHVTRVRTKLLESQLKPQLEPLSDNVETSAKIINLCEDRYHFLVTFTASMLAGRITIMPANRSEGELTRLTSNNNDVKLIDDTEISGICLSDNASSADDLSWNISSVPSSMIVAELYTSGSTGMPVAHQKTWGQLVSGAQQVCARFELNQDSQTSIIATVPPQHMFGFEMSIILPLVCGVFIHHDQPFYPLDIQRAVSEMTPPRILVTTPTHLKACVTLTKDWQDIEKVISATSPLSEELASQVETVMDTSAEEIYGCSEIGAIATRRVTTNPDWTLLPDYTLNIEDEDARLHVPAIQQTISLPDKLAILPDSTFRLVGRATDMVKIGGKRGSLADLTAHIKSLQGVEDAAVFKLEHDENQRERLAALVIAHDVTSEQLREALAKEVDPVFLPRPLYLVSSLPYTATGKLPRTELLACLKQHMNETRKC